LVSERRNAAAARAFFTRALTSGPAPVEITTDLAPVYPRVLDEVAPAARHVREQYATDEMSRASPALVVVCAWDSGPPQPPDSCGP
jgi:transposase-like protein